jgi:hypothetical protein
VLAEVLDIGYFAPTQTGDSIPMTKSVSMNFDEVAALLRYEPETGKLFWRVAPSRRNKAGDEAGSVKGVRTSVKTGMSKAYRYIRMRDIETPAARVVWLLQTGEWPETNVLYKDGDPTNLKWENLTKGEFLTVKDDSGPRRKYKMPKETARHYALKRYYGMTGEEYGEKLAAQKGLCAICNKPETAMTNGVPKVMHVDHDHKTGAIRDLLCGSCNGMLGLAKDSSETLRAAADYIDRHSNGNVVKLVPQKGA